MKFDIAEVERQAEKLGVTPEQLIDELKLFEIDVFGLEERWGNRKRFNRHDEERERRLNGQAKQKI